MITLAQPLHQQPRHRLDDGILDAPSQSIPLALLLANSLGTIAPLTRPVPVPLAVRLAVPMQLKRRHVTLLPRQRILTVAHAPHELEGVPVRHAAHLLPPFPLAAVVVPAVQADEGLHAPAPCLSVETKVAHEEMESALVAVLLPDEAAACVGAQDRSQRFVLAVVVDI